ncbi:OsmC family protein [Geodermatophilus sp. SYSU D00742]
MSPDTANTTATERNDLLGRVIGDLAAAIEADAGNAAVTFRATGQCEEPVGTRLRIGGHAVRQDEPAVFAGSNAAPNPVEYALAALLSCQLVTYRFWAAKLDVPIDDIRATVDGDLDLRGFLGLDEQVRPGYGEVRFTVTVRGPAAPERYQELAAAVNEHCPTLDIFRNPTPVRTELVIG